MPDILVCRKIRIPEFNNLLFDLYINKKLFTICFQLSEFSEYDCTKDSDETCTNEECSEVFFKSFKMIHNNVLLSKGSIEKLICETEDNIPITIFNIVHIGKRKEHKCFEFECVYSRMYIGKDIVNEDILKWDNAKIFISSSNNSLKALKVPDKVSVFGIDIEIKEEEEIFILNFNNTEEKICYKEIKNTVLYYIFLLTCIPIRPVYEIVCIDKTETEFIIDYIDTGIGKLSNSLYCLNPTIKSKDLEYTLIELNQKKKDIGAIITLFEYLLDKKNTNYLAVNIFLITQILISYKQYYSKSNSKKPTAFNSIRELLKTSWGRLIFDREINDNGIDTLVKSIVGSRDFIGHIDVLWDYQNLTLNTGFKEYRGINGLAREYKLILLFRCILLSDIGVDLNTRVVENIVKEIESWVDR